MTFLNNDSSLSSKFYWTNLIHINKTFSKVIFAKYLMLLKEINALTKSFSSFNSDSLITKSSCSFSPFDDDCNFSQYIFVFKVSDNLINIISNIFLKFFVNSRDM